MFAPAMTDVTTIPFDNRLVTPGIILATADQNLLA
jgi:hypothetical protein